MTTARRFPKVDSSVDPQLKNALYVNVRNFWNQPAPEVDPIQDAAVISEKVKRSSCFGAAIAVLAPALIVAGLIIKAVLS